MIKMAGMERGSGLFSEKHRKIKKNRKNSEKSNVMEKKTKMDEKLRKSKNSEFWSTKIRKNVEDVENDKGGSNNEQKNQNV
jgi:hypothetical protein